MTPTPGVTTPPTEEQIDPESVRRACEQLVTKVHEQHAARPTPPTDEQVRAARSALGITPDVPNNCLRDWEHRNIRRVAQALADQAAAIHARYEKVAEAQRESCERWWQEAQGADEPDRSYAIGRQHASDQAAIAIREVSR